VFIVDVKLEQQRAGRREEKSISHVTLQQCSAGDINSELEQEKGKVLFTKRYNSVQQEIQRAGMSKGKGISLLTVQQCSKTLKG